MLVNTVCYVLFSVKIPVWNGYIIVSWAGDWVVEVGESRVSEGEHLWEREF